MSDLIDRQDSIDAIHEDADWLAAQGSDWQAERMERDKSILMSLPSAEKAQLSGEDATFDCISRQAAIDAEHVMPDIKEIEKIIIDRIYIGDQKLTDLVASGRLRLVGFCEECKHCFPRSYLWWTERLCK